MGDSCRPDSGKAGWGVCWFLPHGQPQHIFPTTQFTICSSLHFLGIKYWYASSISFWYIGRVRIARMFNERANGTANVAGATKCLGYCAFGTKDPNGICDQQGKYLQLIKRKISRSGAKFQGAIGMSVRLQSTSAWGSKYHAEMQITLLLALKSEAQPEPPIPYAHG